jgi:hypothetical protein
MKWLRKVIKKYKSQQLALWEWTQLF